MLITELPKTSMPSMQPKVFITLEQLPTLESEEAALTRVHYLINRIKEFNGQVDMPLTTSGPVIAASDMAVFDNAWDEIDAITVACMRNGWLKTAAKLCIEGVVEGKPTIGQLASYMSAIEQGTGYRPPLEILTYIKEELSPKKGFA